MRRISIKSLMLYVSFIAVGLAALRNANELWASLMLTLTLATLGAAIIAIVCRHGSDRVWWFSFALFGTAYAILTLLPWFVEIRPNLVTTYLLEFLCADAIPAPMSEIRRAEQLDLMERRLAATDPSDPAYDWRRLSIVGVRRNSGYPTPSTPRLPGRIQILLPGVAHWVAFTRIGHCLFALIAGLVGAFISSRMYREPEQVVS